jgi:hypothetical protein
MAKQFFTERDIEDMAARGVLTLTVSDEVVLTDLAYEKAECLGVKLIQPHPQRPGAPVRPYLAEPVALASAHQVKGEVLADEALRQRIRSAVRAKFGDEIDPQLLEKIITRVLDNIGAK